MDSINNLSNYFDEIAAKKPRVSGGKNAPLVKLFKDAQQKIVEAILHCENDETTKQSLQNLIRAMRSLEYSYTRLSSNPFVRMGLIKPRGMSEALQTAKATIHQAKAAVEVLSDLKIAHSFELKTHLKALEGDDPQVLIKLLEASGAGGDFETCRDELEELATEQFQQLARLVSMYKPNHSCIYEKGKWKFMRNRLGHTTNDKAKADALLAYMPYVKFEDIKIGLWYPDGWGHQRYEYRLIHVQDHRIRLISSICRNGVNNTRTLFAYGDVTPDLAKALIRIARDENDGKLLRDALLLEHLKNFSPAIRKVEYDAINGLLDRRHEIRARWEHGTFDPQDFKILYEMIRNGFFENRPLAIASNLDNPVLARLLKDEMPQHANFQTKAMWLALQSMKKGVLEDKEEAALLFKNMLVLESGEMSVHCKEVFQVYNKLTEFKVAESSLEADLRKLFPQISSMEEQVMQPPADGEPFEVSAMRFALESPLENRMKLFEDLIAAERLDKEYPLMNTLPAKLTRLTSLDEAALAFLKPRFPYIVYVVCVLKNKERQEESVILPIDQQIDLHGDIMIAKRPGGTFRYEEMLLIDPNQKWSVPNQELCDSGRKLMDREDAGDVKLRANGKKRKVFSELILGACPGKKIDIKDDTVQFPTNFTPEELNAFLQFCYTGEIPESSDRVLFSLYAKADVLGSDALKDYCSRRLISKTSLDNVLDFAKLAVEFHAGALLQHMVRFIKIYAKPNKGNFTSQQREEIAQIAKSIIEVPIEMPQVEPYTPNVFNLKALKDDFVFVGKNGVNIHANKLLLSLRSGYFAARMRFPKGKTTDKEDFDFDDMLLLKLVKFMKEGVLPEDLSGEDLAALNQAAGYFDIPLLKSVIHERDSVIGPADWTELGVNGIDESQALDLLPDNIEEILAQPSAFHLDKTIGESFLLICIPEGQTCDSLERLSKEHTLLSDQGFSIFRPVKNHLNTQRTNLHWVLIAPDVVPETLNKTPEEINALLASKSSDVVRYSTPPALDVMAASVVRAHKSTKPFLKNVWTICAEKVNNKEVAIGNFGWDVINVTHLNENASKHDAIGVMPMIILS